MPRDNLFFFLSICAWFGLGFLRFLLSIFWRKTKYVGGLKREEKKSQALRVECTRAVKKFLVKKKRKCLFAVVLFLASAVEGTEKCGVLGGLGRCVWPFMSN